MKKALIALVVAAVCLAALVVPVMVGLASMLFGAAAQANQNPCVSSIGVVAPTGGPVRIPVVGGYQVTSEYGMRSNPGNINTGEYRLHAGIDFAQTGGQGPIVAATAGVVAATTTTSGGGNQVWIDHGGGLETRYKHLSSWTVEVGDKVAAGQQLGVEGSTGNSSGAHLHFEVRIDGAPADPRGWLTEAGVEVPPPGGSGDGAPASEDSSSFDAVEILAASYELAPIGEPGQTQPVASKLPTQVGPYKGSQITNAAYAVKAGQRMGLDAQTITIGLMAEMGESTLVNVDYGDAVRNDTIGLFQIGPEHGEYEQRMDPTWAATNFFTRLTAVPDYQSLEPTIAAHRAQKNADPYHYQPYWDDAVLMVSTLTDDPSLLESMPVTGPVGGCENGGPAGPPPAGDGTGADIVAAAQHYAGTPYSWGGGHTSGPTLGTYTSASLDGTNTVGFDCSGLVIFAVHSATGTELPHSAEAQGQDSRGQTIPRDWSQMQPGDIISFSQDGSGAPGSYGHVGIYAGDGKMIHAPRTGKPVATIDLQNSTYYEAMEWSIKRYTN